MDSKNMRVKVNNGVCVATLDNAGEKVNSVNMEVLSEMENFINDVSNDPGISSVVVISGMSTTCTPFECLFYFIFL